jgi:hypothetical protein
MRSQRVREQIVMQTGTPARKQTLAQTVIQKISSPPVQVDTPATHAEQEDS